MSGMNPTYQSGFASPQRGRVKYPGLWRGCVGAWSPCLGPSGLVLRDHSGFGNHGVLTNGPAFSTRSGRYSISLDGSNDYIDCGTSNVYDLSHTQPFIISCWINSTQTTNDTHAIVSRWETPALKGWFMATHNNGVVLFQVQQSGSVYKYQYGAKNVADGSWHHIAATNDGTGTLAGMRIYVDGVVDTGSPMEAGSMSSIQGTRNLYLGHRTTGVDIGAVPFAGHVADVRILTNTGPHAASIVNTLRRRPGIAYELAPRRRSSIQVPANITRYNLFTGSAAIQIIGGAS